MKFCYSYLNSQPLLALLYFSLTRIHDHMNKFFEISPSPSPWCVCVCVCSVFWRTLTNFSLCRTSISEAFSWLFSNHLSDLSMRWVPLLPFSESKIHISLNTCFSCSQPAFIPSFSKNVLNFLTMHTFSGSNHSTQQYLEMSS